MFDKMESIGGGYPVVVAIIISAMPVIILLLQWFFGPMGRELERLVQENEPEEAARAAALASMSYYDRHNLLLRHATIWGYIWTAAGVSLPIVVSANSAPSTWHIYGDSVIKLGLASFIASLAFLAVVAVDRKLNLRGSGQDWIVVRLHLPGCLYGAVFALTWTGLFIAALL